MVALALTSWMVVLKMTISMAEMVVIAFTTVKQVRTILMAAMTMTALKGVRVMTNSSGSKGVTTSMAVSARTSFMGVMMLISC
jgi:hypothetical protein